MEVPSWILLLSFLLCLCGGIANAKTINVVTSFTVLQDVVRNISGDKAKVQSLVGYDQDPHGFELKPKDMKIIAEYNTSLLLI